MAPEKQQASEERELAAQVEEELAAIKGALRRAISASGLTEGEVSRRMGYRRTYLSSLFASADAGRAPTKLRVETLLAILHLLKIDPIAFLARALPAHETRAPDSPDADESFVEAVKSGDSRRIAELAAHPEKVPESELAGVVQAALNLVIELTKVVGPDRLATRDGETRAP